MKYKNQQTILKGYLCYYGGMIISFSSLLIMIIFGNKITSSIKAFLFIIGIILVIGGIGLMLLSPNYNILYNCGNRSFFHPSLSRKANGLFIQGVPNNSRREFLIPYSQLIKENELVFQKIAKGIYQLSIQDKKYVFDMRKWVRQKYYIYEIILTIIVLHYQTSFVEKKDDLCIIFANKKYQVIKYGRIKKKILFVVRFSEKKALLKRFYNIKKLDINHFYSFYK